MVPDLELFCRYNNRLFDPDEEDARPPCIELTVRYGIWETDFVRLPLNLSPDALLRTADKFVIYQATKGRQCTYSRQKLVNSYRRAQQIHRDSLARNERAALAGEAEETARALLRSLNEDLYKAVERNKPFYLQGEKTLFIVHPRSRQIIALLPDAPVSLCVYITDPAVQGNIYDWTIAMWKLIVGAEDRFLTTANKFDRFPGPLLDALDKIKL